MTGDTDDPSLSAYEKQRLRNIRRNRAMLSSLGLDKTLGEIRAEQQLESQAKKVKRERRKRAREGQKAEAPQRRSGRLAGRKADGFYVERELAGRIEVVGASQILAEEEVAEQARDPGDLPEKPEHLTKAEKRVYELLRKHRKSVSSELQLEPYKVANNRTLCEMVRLLPETVSQLLEIWGMGPAKVKNYGEGLLLALQPHLANLQKHALKAKDGATQA